MTKMDHARPILRLIDEIKRQRTRASFVPTKPKPSAVTKKRRASVTAENVLIHHAACSVLTHIGRHSDVRLADRLLEGVPATQRKRLRSWFSEFGPVEFVGAKAKYRRGATISLGRAMDKPFWLFEI